MLPVAWSGLAVLPWRLAEAAPEVLAQRSACGEAHLFGDFLHRVIGAVQQLLGHQQALVQLPLAIRGAGDPPEVPREGAYAQRIGVLTA